MVRVPEITSLLMAIAILVTSHSTAAGSESGEAAHRIYHGSSRTVEMKVKVARPQIEGLVLLSGKLSRKSNAAMVWHDCEMKSETDKMCLPIAMAILIVSHSVAEVAAATKESTLFHCNRKMGTSRAEDGGVLPSGKYPQRDLAAVIRRETRSSNDRVKGYLVRAPMHNGNKSPYFPPSPPM